MPQQPQDRTNVLPATESWGNDSAKLISAVTSTKAKLKRIHIEQSEKGKSADIEFEGGNLKNKFFSWILENIFLTILILLGIILFCIWLGNYLNWGLHIKLSLSTIIAIWKWFATLK